MQQIRMVDLHGQYLKIKSEIDEAIQNVITSTAFINGPDVKSFKQNLSNYLNADQIITCANGTDALQIALMALDLKRGDEVIAPDFTFIATAEVIALLGLTPVFVDVDPHTFNLDIDKLKNAITEKTKAIIPVHLFGQCADMNRILQIARENELFVIEDNAQAIGADYKLNNTWHKAGTLGDIGCLSFFPSKNLGCYGDGGAISTNNPELAEKMSCVANHGSKVKYHNNDVGVNSRLDTMQAAILNVKLKYLDDYIKARQTAAYFYYNNLNSIEGLHLPQKNENSTHVFHQFTIKLEEGRDELKGYLANKGIPSMIYYPLAMHQQEAYKTRGDFSTSEMLCNSVLALPMHTELTTEQQDFICQSIKDFYA